MSLPLLTFGAATGEQITAPPGGFQVHWLLVIPAITFNLLVSGARERFAVRSTASRRYWFVIALFIGGFVTLGILWFSGIWYPWWLNIALPLVMFIALVVEPIRRLRSMRGTGGKSWQSSPLSWPARLMTVAIGLVYGLLLVTSTHRLAAALVFLLASVYLVVQVGMQNSRFGLARTGYEWGPLRWGSFGLCAGIIFVSVLLVVHTSWLTPVLFVSAGVLVTLIMSIAALLPRPGSPGPPSVPGEA